jgi:hypothetical protein
LRKREGGNMVFTMGKKKGEDIGRKGRKPRDIIQGRQKGVHTCSATKVVFKDLMDEVPFKCLE